MLAVDGRDVCLLELGIPKSGPDSGGLRSNVIVRTACASMEGGSATARLNAGFGDRGRDTGWRWPSMGRAWMPTFQNYHKSTGSFPDWTA
jgi:hypothetical protein